MDPYKTDEPVSGNHPVYQTVTFYHIVEVPGTLECYVRRTRNACMCTKETPETIYEVLVPTCNLLEGPMSTISHHMWWWLWRSSASLGALVRLVAAAIRWRHPSSAAKKQCASNPPILASHAGPLLFFEPGPRAGKSEQGRASCRSRDERAFNAGSRPIRPKPRARLRFSKVSHTFVLCTRIIFIPM